MESERGRTDAPAAVIDDEAAGFFAALARTNLDGDGAIELRVLSAVTRRPVAHPRIPFARSRAKRRLLPFTISEGVMGTETREWRLSMKRQ